MSEGKMKGAHFYLAVSFLLMWFLVQSVNSFRLRKTERRAGHREALSSRTVYGQEGVILFGRAFEKGTGLELKVVNWTKNAASNSSEEDKRAYQADSPPVYHNPLEINPKEMAWSRMSPQLQCSKDQMKFTATGPGSSLLAVEQKQENAPPMPLSQVPPSCGYTMHRSPLTLALLVPFDGCNVVQEGGSYILPMRWQGSPVSLWCPKPSDPSLPPTDLPKNNPTQMPQKLMAPHPVYNYMQPPVQQSNVQKPAPATNGNGIKNMPFYSYVYVPWPVPATQQPPEMTTIPPPKLPHVPKFPYVPQVPQMPNVPQVPQVPQYPGFPKFPQVPQGPLIPQVPQAPQVPQYPGFPKVPQGPQIPQVPQVPQVPQYPGFPKFPQVPQGPLIPQVPQAPQVPQYPGFPKLPQVPQGPLIPPVPQGPQIPIPNDPVDPQMPPVPNFFRAKFVPFPGLPAATAQPPTIATTAAPATMKPEPVLTPVQQNPYLYPYIYDPYLYNFPVPNKLFRESK
ncbi:protein PELPK1 isoform X4 [Cynoglossus semilaevis]|uniref:protein PELPK1 isoform X4 n=1 Tax=Cynoglossus semilaevis TaxID=244447 RepID=UPI000495A413|nr:protein PELPK1 isoform X4 [Cynoglossus semilaevis]